jgi:AcrR family transcriptional regulator
MSRAPAAMPPQAEVSADGRRRRGQDNRARIVAAMLEIIQTGDLTPSAEQVAQRADVGLRTVFRHFQDMDSLFREMSVVIMGALQRAAEAPFRSEDWRERVVELVERRGWAFERVGPFLSAATLIRRRSKYMDVDHARLVAALREILEQQLPSTVTRDKTKLEALDLLLSFEAWSRLRREQRLSPEQAQETLEAAVRRLLN